MTGRSGSNVAVFGGPRTVPEGLIRPWPPIDDTDRERVLASLNGPNHAFGPNCRAFMDEFAAWNGNRHAIFTNSGTAALHMALVGCGVGAGDEVLVPAYSWSSSATCIIHHNAIPVFVDIDFETMNIDPALIEAAVTPRTKAIIVVHLHGLAADLDPILSVAVRHGLAVVEDCCQAHGALYRGRKVGTFGRCSAFSFNQNKCLCAGEGGMFVSDDDASCRAAEQLWNFGETRTPLESRDYHAYALGWMYRGGDMPAAFGRAQLAKLDGYLETQRRNAAALTRRLRNTPALILPTEPDGYRHNWYNYTVRIDMAAIGNPPNPRRMRDAVMKALQAEGVPVSVWQNFILPAMTVFQAKNAYGKGSPWREHGAETVDYSPERFPVATRHTDTHFGMTVPLRAPNGTDVAEAVADAFEKVFSRIGSLDPDAVLGSA